MFIFAVLENKSVICSIACEDFERHVTGSKILRLSLTDHDPTGQIILQRNAETYRSNAAKNQFYTGTM